MIRQLLADIRIARRMLARDWRSGELYILAVALIIATASVSSVGFFVERVQKAMDQQASELLAADLVVGSTRPVAAEYTDEARRLNLKLAQVMSFRSVVMSTVAPQLVEVKAVSNNYPLRGRIKIASIPFSEVSDTVTHGPPPGEVWVEESLLHRLSLSVGNTVMLGARTLRISHILVYEPDRGGDMFNIAPRVLMHTDDVAETGLLGPGARVNYRLLLAGQPASVLDYRHWFARQKERGRTEGLRLLSARDGRPEIRTALERARHFLGLAALVSVFLAGVAIATTTRRFIQRHLDTSAILRCVGATQARILRLFFAEMLYLALLATSVGCLLGFAAQFVISLILGRLFLLQLPATGFNAIAMGYATGIILLLGFALPPLLALKQVSPLRVLRRDLSMASVQGRVVYAGVLLSLIALLYLQTGQMALVAWVLLGMSASVVLLGLCAYALVIGLRRSRHLGGVGWRFGLANIARRPLISVVQIVALGIGLMVMLTLSIVRLDLLDGWQASLPDNAPNHFLINIQTTQVDGIKQYLSKYELSQVELYPMVRARLRRINGIEVSPDEYPDGRARHLLTREFNLSWAEQMQSDNRLTSGRWWSAADRGKPWISLEQGLADTLGIKLHDSLTFNVNGVEQTFTVESLRTVEWDSFNVNFFTIVNPGNLDPESASWVTSVYISPEQKRLLSQLVLLYPNLTIIDIAAILDQVRAVIDRVTLAVEFIFIFTIIAGVVVLLAAIQASHDERRFEGAVLRTLGASRRILLAGLGSEFLVLGIIAGLLAGVSASGVSWILATRIFHFSFHFDPYVIIAGLVIGPGIVGIAGLLGTRSVLSQPPLLTLRGI